MKIHILIFANFKVKLFIIIILMIIFKGALLSELGQVKMNIKNFVHRGSVLKETEYIFGVVTYVGKETKIMMNGN